MRFSPARQFASEALGTALLLAVVIGSGIMGEQLSGGSAALALLGNTLATAAALVVLISVFAPVSGAHFNPVVTLIFVLRRELPVARALGYVASQMAGALCGVLAAHAMFAEPLFQVSTKLRSGPGQAFSEFMATFGLVLTILGSTRFNPRFTAASVGFYIAAAYWFTASTSFANPAVTIARGLSNTFAGLAPASAPAFIGAQAVGALCALLVMSWMLREEEPEA